MTSSFLPNLPPGWGLSPLKHACSLNPEVLSETAPDDQELLYVDISALEGGASDLTPKPLRFGQAPSRARRVLRSGDTILSTVRTYLRAVATFPDIDETLVASTGFAVLRPNGKLFPKFTYWAALCEPFIENVVAHSDGVSYPAISPSVLGTLPMPVPPRDAQERIANFLDEKTARIDALIAAKTRLLETLDAVREAFAFSLISGSGWPDRQLGEEDRPWLAAVPSDWSTPKLGYIAEVGNGSTPRREKAEYWEEGTISWLTSSALNDRVVTSASEAITELAVRDCHLRVLRPGSTLVGLIGQGPTRGMAAALRCPAAISQNLAYVTPTRHNIVDEYVTVALTGLYSALRYISDGVGGAQGSMDCGQLRNFRIPLPPEEVQKSIVHAFRQQEAASTLLLHHAEKHLALLHEYRASLISAAVTGQLEISSYRDGA